MHKYTLPLSSLSLSAIFLFGAGNAVFASGHEGDPTNGKELFQKHCTACHNVMEGATPDVYGVVLPLHGIIGKKAGLTKGFYYSKAMRNSNATWTKEFLDKYLEDPKGTIPGIRMEFYGLESAKERKDIIAYIAKEQENK